LSQGWVARIIAGTAGVSGSVDGPAASSKLSSPVSCATANGVVYFIEQGRIPAVRCFAGGEIKTIFSGAPLKNLTDLCAGDLGTLLLCDRGSSCIWQLDLTDKRITPLVTTADVIGENDAKLSFTPSGIVKVADGAYLFSDLSRHQIFRLMTSGCAYEALQASHLTYSSLEDVSAQSSQAVTNYLEHAHEVKSKMLHGVTHLWRMKEAILDSQFSQELRRLSPLLDHKSFPRDGLSFLLRNAPSFVSVENLLRGVVMTPDSFIKLQEAISVFVQYYDFSSPLINTKSELQALTNIFKFSLPIAGQELFCKILKDER
jgi:hypothetical protein